MRGIYMVVLQGMTVLCVCVGGVDREGVQGRPVVVTFVG